MGIFYLICLVNTRALRNILIFFTIRLEKEVAVCYNKNIRKLGNVTKK